MEYFKLTIPFVLIATSFIYALRAAFSSMHYIKRSGFNLTLDEMDVRDGTATIKQRIRLFLINFIFGLVTPLIWIMAIPIAIIISIILNIIF